MRYRFIARERKAYPVTLMCRLLGVSRAGFYDFLVRCEEPEDPEHRERIDWVRKIAEASDHTYGSRRMARALTVLGYPTGRDRARRLMREAEVWVRYRRRYKATTQSDHGKPVFDNILQRDFQASAPDRAWVSDVSYVWTSEGWLYLAVVLDLFSRKVVGWSLSTRLHAKLVQDALLMALWQRKPAPGLVFHSDRGSQYASRAVRSLLDQHRMVGSMSRKGDCWDNAVAESFFGSLKSERLSWRRYRTRREAYHDIVEYIAMFYNPHRLHSTLGYQSPDAFERQAERAKAA